MEKTTENSAKIEAILEDKSTEKDESNLAGSTENSEETEMVSWNKKFVEISFYRREGVLEICMSFVRVS